MPTYEYACSACKNAWEQEQRISEAPIEKCPKCGKKTAKRQISGGGAFILKGGGWYADGYGSAKSSGSGSSSSSKPSKSAADSSSSSSSEAAKPAATESKPKADTKAT